MNGGESLQIFRQLAIESLANVFHRPSEDGEGLGKDEITDSIAQGFSGALDRDAMLLGKGPAPNLGTGGECLASGSFPLRLARGSRSEKILFSRGMLA